MDHIEENTPLAPHTTFGVGGKARFFTEVQSKTHLYEVLRWAIKKGVGVCALGSGSNTLVPDEGVNGLILHMNIQEITSCEEDTSTNVLVHAGAGVLWDTLIRYTTSRGLWGIENLAGIPGTVGAAPVQNIGAYGMELSDTFVSADVVTFPKMEQLRIDIDQAQFGYRESIFKKNPSMIITGVTLRLSRVQTMCKTYADLEDAREHGIALDTPLRIANALKNIRSKKFTIQEGEGTAGSFFKNPVISKERYDDLLKNFPELPGFPIGQNIKIPLAWILDKVLCMRGFRKGNIYLHEHQPLVLVVCQPSTMKEVDNFVCDITARVKTATGINIEKEVCLCRLVQA